MTERYKKPAELSADEHLAVIRAKKQGSPAPKFERADYQAAKIEALRDAGLEEEAAETEEAAAAPKSVAGHLKAIRRQHAAPGRLPRRI